MHRIQFCLATATLLACALAGASYAATLEIVAPAGTRIYVEDRELGTSPLVAPLQLDVGHYELRFEAHGYQRTVVDIQIKNAEEQRVEIVQMTPLSRSVSTLRSLLLLGLGQHYQDRSRSGWLFLAGEAAGIGVALWAQGRASTFADDYDAALALYRGSVDEASIARYRAEAADAADSKQKAESMRDIALGVAGGVALWSILDAWWQFPEAPALRLGLGESPAGGLASAGHRGTESLGAHLAWELRF